MTVLTQDYLYLYVYTCFIIFIIMRSKNELIQVENDSVYTINVQSNTSNEHVVPGVFYCLTYFFLLGARVHVCSGQPKHTFHQK